MKKVIRIVGKVFLGIIALIVFAIIVLFVWNKICNIGEKKYLKSEDKLIEVEGLKIHASITGEGEQTIVLLSGLGTPCPALDFKPLATKLSENYQVVIIEYPGYGFSEDTNKERTVENIISEVRGTLQALEIEPPYILMPHSISGMYSIYYANQYPDEVKAIIGIDSSMPKQFGTQSIPKIPESSLSMYKFMEQLGITRLGTYLPVLTYMNQVRKSDAYSKEELKEMMALYVSHSMTTSMLNENNMITQNSKTTYDLVFPDTLPVLFFLSTQSEEGVKGWEEFHTEAFTNPSIQRITKMDGVHYLQWYYADEIAEQTVFFINEVVENADSGN